MNRSTFLRQFAGGIVALVAAPTLLEAKSQQPDEIIIGRGVLEDAKARPRGDWLSEFQRSANARLKPQGLYVLLWKDADCAVIRGTVFGGRVAGWHYSRRQHFMVSLTPMLRTPTNDRRRELARSLRYQIFCSAYAIDETAARGMI